MTWARLLPRQPPSNSALTEGTEFCQGSGVGGEMLGLRHYAGTLGKAGNITASDSSGHSLLADDFAKLLHEGLSAVYALRGSFVMTLKTLGLCRSLKSTSGQYLYQPSIGGFGPTLLDRPVVVLPDCTELDGVTAGLDPVYYGDFRTAFTLVDRSDVVVQRLDQPYAEQGKLLYFVYKRVTGGVVMPEAIARLVTA